MTRSTAVPIPTRSISPASPRRSGSTWQAAGVEAFTQDAADLTPAGTWRQLADVTNVENVTGTDANDELMGDAAANVLLGGGGNDRLEGRGGNDTIDGGTGTDTAVFNDFVQNFSFTLNGTDLMLTNAVDGTDTIANSVEELRVPGRHDVVAERHHEPTT